MAPKNEKWKKAGKTLNLTKKQVAAGRRVGKAGQSKVRAGEVKQARQEVKIQDTTWKKASERTGPRARGGILLNKDGKPVTGTVTLASGAKATYVRGKRVAAAKPKPKPVTSRSGNGSRAASIPTTRPSAAQTGAGAGGTRNTGGATTSRISSDNLRTLGRARSIARRTGSQQAGRQASTIRGTGRPMSTPSYTTGQGRATSTSQPKNPKIGQRWTQRLTNGQVITRVYTAGGWRVSK